MAVPILGDFSFNWGRPGATGELDGGLDSVIFDELSYSFLSGGHLVKPVSYSFEFYTYADMQNNFDLFPTAG